jgi:predicted RNA-binding protein YlqC (UPF0109 family)
VIPVSEELHSLVLYLARALVDSPGDVALEYEERGQKLYFRLAVPDSEKGKVIGRGGRTARALRLLVGAAAAKQGLRAELEIVDA